MNWIIADLLMFVSSVCVYLTMRKAALDKLPSQFNNLAMFALPMIAFAAAAAATHQNMHLTWTQAWQMFGTGVVFSYLGNAWSTRSIELAPNAGYSLIISKSYVVLTSILAVPLFGARLTVPAIIAIGLIVAGSAVIMIKPREQHHAKSGAWIPLAVGAFFCWAFLQLMAKHFVSHGMPTLMFLAYLFLIATPCIALEMWRRKVHFGVVRRHYRPFLLIGLASTGFNFFNFYAVGIAPNVGYVNATNAASIGAVTLLSVVLFKDELTVRKLLGVTGVLAGLVVLFIWK